MRYNYMKIGDRIRALRRKAGWNQTELIERLRTYDVHITRNTLSAIENGNVDKGQACFKMVPALCELFGCSAGHLLGEYDARTWEVEDVSRFTGLSIGLVEQIKDDPKALQYFNDHFSYARFAGTVDAYLKAANAREIQLIYGNSDDEDMEWTEEELKEYPTLRYDTLMNSPGRNEAVKLSGVLSMIRNDFVRKISDIFLSLYDPEKEDNDLSEWFEHWEKAPD